MKILPEAPKLIKKHFSDEDLVFSSQISNLMWGFPAWFEGFFVTAHPHLAPFFNVRVRALFNSPELSEYAASFTEATQKHTCVDEKTHRTGWLDRLGVVRQTGSGLSSARCRAKDTDDL